MYTAVCRWHFIVGAVTMSFVINNLMHVNTEGVAKSILLSVCDFF